MTVGFALTGSFCTFARVIPQIGTLTKAGHRVIPILSPVSYGEDTRFGPAAAWRAWVAASISFPPGAKAASA